ncbi:MAG: hypothetical protein IJ379_11200 [Lachnospiraceae bacterium]|nr:hypothetical protein [Lachnospiraceae bacterium]
MIGIGRMKKEIGLLIQSIIYILMGIQILFGLAWLVTNMGCIPAFEESTELLAMSKSLVIDEYTGMLYPLCLRVVMGLGQKVGVSVLYLLQLAIAGVAYGYFMCKVMKQQHWGKLLFFVGFVLSIPGILQCHMAVLPYSLASSVFVILLADIRNLWQKDIMLTKKDMVRLAVWWIFSAQLCPDYGWLSGIVLGISIVYYMLLHKQPAVKLLALFLSGALCIAVLNAAIQTEGSMGKIQKSMGAVLIQRFVWPHFASFHTFWSPEITELWEMQEMTVFASFPEQVIYEFGPQVEAAYGRERANEIYWDMAVTAIGLDTKNVLQNMLVDTVSYICPPLTMKIQLEGMGVSHSGWNYGRMKEYTPILTKYYVNYALNVWVYLLVLCGVLGCLSWKKKTEEKVSCTEPVLKRNRIGLYPVLTVLLIDLWYMMCTGGMQDYKKVIVNSILWAFLIVKISAGKR